MSDNKVTKADLIDAVFRDTNVERRTVQKVTESLLDAIRSSLESGKSIELRGFGTFDVKLRKGRNNVRNPKTGEQFSMESHYVVGFRSGREMKSAIMNLPVGK